MITKLRISNFKSHDETFLNMNHLSVLTGVNGCGKTSVIQALLLLRQTFLKGRLQDGLDLNNPLCSIGLAHDALYRLASTGVISIEFATDDGKDFIFEFDVEGGLKDSYIKKCRFNENAENLSLLRSLPLFNDNFQYISALRWGGKSNFPKETYAVEHQGQISLNNGQGELVAHYLHKFGCDSVPNYSDLNKGMSSLLEQVIFWERKITPNVILEVEQASKMDTFIIRYGFEGDNDVKPIRDLGAENIGFGVSYALPVIVALLSAKPDSLIIIENPEAHLHPGGQAELAKLITMVASTGAQIIVETHSDHIISGIQLACKAFSLTGLGLSAESVKLNHFYAKYKHSSMVQEIRLQENGRLEYQPKGFFDQSELDMRVLFGNGE